MINTLLARAKLNQLVQMLQEEREVLLHGPLDKLGPLVARRDSMLDALVNGGPVARKFLNESLPEIRALATRNARLLQESIKGMKAARSAINAMNNSLNGIETYTSQGQRVTTKSHSVTKGKRV